MSTVTFDTLAYARKLKSAGFTQEQAEVQAEAQKDMLAEILDSSLATKGDIASVKGDIGRLEKEILVLKWMTGFMLAGVLSLILKAFFVK
ncbi:MAG: DUF1640 domain-containing protein [Nitrospinae bacterium]|nr:DUF1640 domain-containing protein [Nitrospinota bacterium]